MLVYVRDSALVMCCPALWVFSIWVLLALLGANLVATAAAAAIVAVAAAASILGP